MMSSSSSTSPAKIATTREHELELHKLGYTHVLATDECGRGCLAGSVVACAAVVSPHAKMLRGVTDSKKIKKVDLQRLYNLLTKSSDIKYAIGQIEAERIDEINILQATFEAMDQAVQGVLKQLNDGGLEDATSTSTLSTKEEKQASQKFAFALVDGNKVPPQLEQRFGSQHCEAVIKGDLKCYSIAVASIIAKVHRDNLMTKLARQYPHYGFHKHVGYPTKAHKAALEKYGPCPLHRRTFAPVRAVIAHRQLTKNDNDKNLARPAKRKRA